MSKVLQDWLHNNILNQQQQTYKGNTSILQTMQ